MRRDDLYLQDIVEASASIREFIQGHSLNSFSGDDLTRSAVLQKLIVIGESAARLSDGFKLRCPDIEWRDIITFRNIAVHAYFSVDWSIVWHTAIHDAPLLAAQVEEILNRDPPLTDVS